MEENLPKNYSKKIIYISLFYVAFIIFDYFTKDISKTISMQVFFSTDKTRCDYFIYSDYFERGLKYFMYYISYNYINIYTSFFMIFAETLSTFIISNLKIIYKELKPSLEYSEYPSCLMFNSYGTPSSTACSLFLLFGIFYKAFTSKNKNKSLKFFCGLLWFVIINYACLVKILQNSLYLNQVIYGYVIGYVLYYIFFNICEIDLFNFSQFKLFLKFKWSIILVSISIFIFNTFFQFIITKPYLENNSNSFMNQNYLSQTIFFEFLGYYIGILLEYILIFKSTDLFYCRYNIAEKNRDGIEMFNHTKSDVSLFRLLLFCFTDYYLTVSIPINVDFINCLSYSKLILSLPLFKRTLKGILLFFLLKYTIKYLGLTNEKINEGYFRLQ